MRVLTFVKSKAFQDSPNKSNFVYFIRRYSFALTLLLWIVIVASRIFLNGFVYGLDYSLYHPDGAHYAFRTLSFLSNSDYSAALEVSNWYAIHGIKHNLIEPFGLLPENNPAWNLVAPRILYPILSIPFVFVFGLSGMLAIPMLSLLGVMMVSNSIGRFYGRTELGLLFSLLLITSVTVGRWFVANITDGLLTFLLALFVQAEIRVLKLRNWSICIILIVVFASITRFSLPIFLAISFGYLLLRNFKKALIVTLSATFGAAPLFFFNVSSAFLPGADTQSLTGKLTEFPLQSIKVLLVEIGQLLILDRQFLILIVFGLFCAYKAQKNTRTLTLCVFMGVLLIGFINGTLGVNFRYQLPIIPFLAWSFIEYLAVNRKSI